MLFLILRKLRAPSIEDRVLRKSGTHTKKFGFLASASDFDQCFDFDFFCWNYFWPFIFEQAFGTDAFADAWASASTICFASANALANTEGFIAGEGHFTLTRNGSNGSVTAIDLSVNVDSAKLVIASSTSMETAGIFSCLSRSINWGRSKASGSQNLIYQNSTPSAPVSFTLSTR